MTFGPREVLTQWRQATIDQSVDALRRLHAIDAVYEFPFAYPGVPTRFDGRDDIVNWVAELWQANPLRFKGYRTLAIHNTDDPDTIIVEQEAITTSSDTALPSIMVLTVHDGQIASVRDYVNVLAAATALGENPVTPGR